MVLAHVVEHTVQPLQAAFRALEAAACQLKDRQERALARLYATKNHEACDLEPRSFGWCEHEPALVQPSYRRPAPLPKTLRGRRALQLGRVWVREPEGRLGLVLIGLQDRTRTE